MKYTKFTWADSDGAAMLPDVLMDRGRAARLIRAWRRRARLPSNSRALIITRTGIHAVRVEDPNYSPPVVAHMAWCDSAKYRKAMEV